MTKDIITFYNGSALSVSKEVADLLNIEHGYTITTEDELWKILSANANHVISRCRLLKSIEKN